jgi:hypothetical protein
MWSLTSVLLLLLAHLMANNNRITDKNVTVWQLDKVSVRRIKQSHCSQVQYTGSILKACCVIYASCVSPRFHCLHTSPEIKL